MIEGQHTPTHRQPGTTSLSAPNPPHFKVAWLGHLEGKAHSDGLSTYTREACSQLRRCGVETILFHHEPSTDQTTAIKVPTGFRFKTMRVPSPGSGAYLAGQLKRSHVDLVHVSISFSLLDWRLPEIAHQLGLPVIATFHVPYDRRPSWRSTVLNMIARAYAPALSRYDQVIVFSQEHRQQLIAAGVKPDVLAVIPNGVDINRYSPGSSEFRSRSELQLLVTYMGRLDPEKNCDVLCSAWSEMDLPPRSLLLVVGSGSERKRLVRRFGSNRSIRFTGLVRSEAERVDMLRGTDVFIQPSAAEGLSLSLLESMSCGCCTLATDAGSDGEVVSGAGIALDPLNLKPQLQLALQICIEHPDLRDKLGMLARQRVIEAYDIERNFANLVAIYERLLGRQQPQP